MIQSVIQLTTQFTRRSNDLTLATLLAIGTITLTLVPHWVQAAPAQFGLSPDNGQSLVVDTIRSAQSELLINMYQLDCDAIKGAILEAIQRGVKVDLLLEGNPVGGVSAAGKVALQEIVEAIKASGTPDSSVFIMTKDGDPSVKRRFTYDHAKYMVIDAARVFISSENFSTSGEADPGYKGNRGWSTVVESADLASQLSQMFASDADTSYGDILNLRSSPIPDQLQADQASGKNPTKNAYSDLGKAGGPRSIDPIARVSGDVEAMELVTSPDSTAGIVSMIQSAQTEIELEYMSLPYDWKNATSPIVAELLAAAHRGVNVRVLLNDDTVFGGSQNGKSSDDENAKAGQNAPFFKASGTKKNLETACSLIAEAQKASIPLSSKIIDIKSTQITYIHNKGILADQSRAFISSINGTENSVMKNRETALRIESRDAAQYYGSVFDFDWENSPFLQAGDCDSVTRVNQLDPLSMFRALQSL